jgi:hypothetical protein
MYKVEIKIGDWDFVEDEVVTVETSDFDKVAIIQEFIAFQQEHGWAADYDIVEEFDDEDEDYVYDEDTDDWYWYDEDADTWYVYDEVMEDWIEYVEDEESEDEAETEEESNTVTHYVITRVEE